LNGLFWRAVIMSWVIVLVPYAAALASWPALAGAAWAGPAIAAGAALFVRAVPDIRHAPQTPRRWVLQAGAAAFASVAVWLLVWVLDAA
jgi:hypothetical protein